MASSNLAQKPIKQLGQLLQERQEPFMLQVYLLERGCLNKDLKSSANLKKRRNCILQCSNEVLRAVLHKLGSANERKQRRRGCVLGDGNFCGIKRAWRGQEVEESDGFSSASSTTAFHSCCSMSDREDTTEALQVCSPEEGEENEVATDTDRRNEGICTEDRKQLSPVSVLETIPSAETSPSYKNTIQEDAITSSQQISQSDFKLNFPKKACGGPKTTSSFLSELFHQTDGEQHEIGGLEPFSLQYTKSRGVLKQSRLLLFDCTRDLAGHHRRKLRAVGRKFADETRITQLIHFDLAGAAGEWSYFRAQASWELGMNIGDAIFEEIRKENVVDIIDFLLPPKQ